MLEIRDVETIDKKKLNHIGRKYKKKQILLYDTKRRIDDFVGKLKYRQDGNYEDIPHFIVSKMGDIYQVLDMDYSSVTFGNHELDKKQVKIAVENLGWLQKNTITGYYSNWIGDPHRSDPFIRSWRDKFYWDRYTDTTNLLPTSTATPINPTPYSYTYWDELRGYDDIPAKDTSTAAPGNQPSDEQKTNLVRGYQACVSYIDKLLGNIMTALRDNSNDEDKLNINNTVIVLWGDQGFHLGDKGQWCKHTNFDVATRIPLIIRDPRVLGGVRLNNVAEALDIYPTLRQLCHLGDATPSHHLEGKDLSSRLHYGAQDEAAHESSNMAVTEYIRNNGNVIGYSIKDTRYKYTRWYNNVENHIDDANNRRYYVRDFSVCQDEEKKDIYHDVDEVENIVAANQDTTLLRDLRMKFMNMVKNIPGEIHGPNTLLSQYQETTTQEDNSLLITLKTKMT